MADAREVGYDAQEHTGLVNTILAETKLKPYNIFRHADLRGKKIVDIGCGDGELCRTSVARGAQYAMGIDGKQDMIDIASSLNSQYEGKVEFRQGFIEDLSGDETFDVAILSYLLNNAKDFKQLTQQCRSTVSFLKPGGMAVIFNNNPFDVLGGDFTKYGFRKTLTGLRDGDPIIYDYRPAINSDIINYYLSPEKHEAAFQIAGFSEFAWKPIQSYPGADPVFWHDYFNRGNLPVIGILGRK
ncbi:class I SAM-dependent methyltransferase [Candidatus Woesearchaeota archaeon]|nr:class I SAM-dependent methyltransferase [Candidatus Woesearchaeota archaeon]